MCLIIDIYINSSCFRITLIECKRKIIKIDDLFMNNLLINIFYCKRNYLFLIIDTDITSLS